MCDEGALPPLISQVELRDPGEGTCDGEPWFCPSIGCQYEFTHLGFGAQTSYQEGTDCREDIRMIGFQWGASDAVDTGVGGWKDFQGGCKGNGRGLQCIF